MPTASPTSRSRRWNRNALPLPWETAGLRVPLKSKRAMIDEDIMAMPMQYNTIVGSLGTALSGGQKQRVLLARALYRRPQVLFLDEAFDQLDVALERRISFGLAPRVTLVVVSHRPETLAMPFNKLELTRERQAVVA